MLPATRCFVLALSAVLLAACGRRAPIEHATPDACTLVAGTAAADTVTIGLSEEVEPAHAPVPAGDDERLVFGTIYSTLVNLDCEGALRPGLAESWSHKGEPGTWTLRLRADASFWDGSPVTAHRVRDSWVGGGSVRSHPWSSAIVSAIAADDRTLILSLRQPGPAGLRALADPRLAVVRGLRGAWPIGAGAYGLAGADSELVRALPVMGMSRDPLPVLNFVTAGQDPRDLLDRRVDLMVTRAPETLDYARRLLEYRVHPLPWDRVYVLAVPSRVGGNTAPMVSGVGVQLASDVIRADARPADGTYWWNDPSSCGSASERSRPVGIAAVPRIVFPEGDATARVIAERVVALLRGGGLAEVVPAVASLRRSELTAVGASATRSPAVAFVMALPARVLDTCMAFAEIEAGTSWIRAANAAAVLVPLVETRPSLIVRDGAAGVSLGFDGAVLLK